MDNTAVTQEVQGTIVGRSLRQAATGALSPMLASQLLVRAADMIDSLGATLMRAKEANDKLVALLVERDKEIDGLQYTMADQQGELAKVAEAFRSMSDDAHARAEANQHEGTNNPEAAESACS